MKNKTFTISIIIIVILSIMLFFTVYHITDEQQKAKWENNEVKMEEIQNQESPAQEYVDLEGLPENYEVEIAVQDGCMVIGNEVYNVEKLEEGIQNINQNIPDKIRIMEFTEEGDEIITDVELTKEGMIQLKVDNTRDKFASIEDRKITEKTYSSQEYQIIQEEYKTTKRVYLENKKEEFDSRVYICAYPFKVENNIPFELEYLQRKDLGIEKIIEKGDKVKYDVYTFGGDVKIKLGEETLNLEDAINQDKITMENILHQCILDAQAGKIETPAEYSDGGSVIYFYPNYSILKCYCLDGNRDVYIGMPGMILTGIEGNMVTYTYGIRNGYSWEK